MLKLIDQVGRPRDLPAHGRRLGGRLQHALRLGQAGRLELRRHPQRHGRLTGPRASRPRTRSARAVQPRHRRRADHPRSRRPARTEGRQRHAADPDGRDEPACQRSTTPRRRTAHATQYFEIAGNRAIYHDGWFAGDIHKAPWEAKPRCSLEAGCLGTLRRRKDFSLRQRPGRRRTRKSSRKCRPSSSPKRRNITSCRSTTASFERLDGELRRPTRPHGRPHVAHPRRGHDRDDGRRLHQREKQVQDHHRRDRGARKPARHGIILVAGRPLRRLGALRSRTASRPTTTTSSASRSSVRSAPRSSSRGQAHGASSSSPTTAAVPARAAPATLFVNDEQVAEGRIEHTQAGIFSADETADVGIDLGTPGGRGHRLRTQVEVHREDPEGDDRGEVIGAVGHLPGEPV